MGDDTFFHVKKNGNVSIQPLKFFIFTRIFSN
jgi:hypothetical protein